MEAGEPILSAREIHRGFETADGYLPVLKGVTLELRRGEMSSVTGASGVGKSTLLHILGGLDRPTSGEVKVGAISFTDKSEEALAKFRNANLGFVFQHHYLLDDFSALENVMIPMILGGVSHAGATEKAEHLLEDVGLIDRRSHRPRELSGGEQQRAAVARALANEPEIVLADEPSGNLDTGTGRKLHDLLRRLNEERSISFLIATHNRELAEGCHREFIMQDGQVAVSKDAQ
ncbi:MAG: ABC transporter ATP-binding protein [Candidatus Zixiibacteriota bacterium]|nr:MAG: ABC transporter ATP-binding protein [candidate division Zixibacteria bacterium]